MSDFNSEYDAAVALADAGQNATAHKKLKQLYDTHKVEQRRNVRLLLWLMYTAPNARTAFAYYAQAANVAPDSDFVQQAYVWVTYKYGDMVRFGPPPEIGFWPTLKSNLKLIVPLAFLSALIFFYAIPNIIGKLDLDRSMRDTQAQIIKIDGRRSTTYQFRDEVGNVYQLTVPYAYKYQRVGDIVTIRYNRLRPYEYSVNPVNNLSLLGILFIVGIFSTGGIVWLLVRTSQGKRMDLITPPRRE